MRRVPTWSLGLFVVVLGCSSGDDDDSSTIFGSGPATMTMTAADSNESSSSAGDGDGDGDPTTTGDGDGDPATGDGDPTTATGDGDPTTGDGDGDVCGNGVIDPGEQCDGANLNGSSCVDQGFDGGVLACDPVVCVFDTSGCTNEPNNQCDANCNGCTCPSDECTMCCALKGKVDVCSGGMCGCF